MSKTQEIYLTEKGLIDTQEKLNYLKTVKRPEMIEALKEARALGDLSENAEYDAARTYQAEIETQITEYEHLIEKAIIIKDVDKNKVSLGSNVKLRYVEDKEEEVYSIVGSKEADLFQNKISNESPLAKSILGLTVGKVVTVDSPNGKYNVEIIEIF